MILANEKNLSMRTLDLLIETTYLYGLCYYTIRSVIVVSENFLRLSKKPEKTFASVICLVAVCSARDLLSLEQAVQPTV